MVQEMKRFSLLTYRVECDFKVGRVLTIKAESVNDALLEGSKQFGVHWSKLSATLAEYIHETTP
jgi:hypothetical protein